tara:strand:- start:1073 stop:1291 length:219 start_codon:yes stop_codon:yes gene_type:complete
MKNKTYSVEFNRLKSGEKFNQNGNAYLKRSSRTAINLDPDLDKNRFWYFGNNEIINIIASNMKEAKNKLIEA